MNGKKSFFSCWRKIENISQWITEIVFCLTFVETFASSRPCKRYLRFKGESSWDLSTCFRFISISKFLLDAHGGGKMKMKSISTFFAFFLLHCFNLVETLWIFWAFVSGGDQIGDILVSNFDDLRRFEFKKDGKLLNSFSFEFPWFKFRTHKKF